jgi:hypothetical protein
MTTERLHRTLFYHGNNEYLKCTGSGSILLVGAVVPAHSQGLSHILWLQLRRERPTSSDIDIRICCGSPAHALCRKQWGFCLPHLCGGGGDTVICLVYTLSWLGASKIFNSSESLGFWTLSPAILNTRKHDISETVSISVFK